MVNQSALGLIHGWITLPFYQNFRTITNLGGVLSHTLSNSIINGSWALSANTSSTKEALDFMNQQIPHFSESCDSIGWLFSLGRFSLKSCWNFLQIPGDDTP